jgi:hypothetical protein
MCYSLGRRLVLIATVLMPSYGHQRSARTPNVICNAPEMAAKCVALIGGYPCIAATVCNCLPFQLTFNKSFEKDTLIRNNVYS